MGTVIASVQNINLCKIIVTGAFWPRSGRPFGFGISSSDHLWSNRAYVYTVKCLFFKKKIVRVGLRSSAFSNQPITVV